MIILGIETSCDETALSLIEVEGNSPKLQFRILAHELISQIKIHEQYGGVFPMLAKREHGRNLVPLFLKTLAESQIKNQELSIEANDRDSKFGILNSILDREEELKELFFTHIFTIPKPNIDRIAVTYGPGLEPALWVGINFAKALSFLWDIPIIPTNHMEGHVAASLLEKDGDKEKIYDVKFPALSLLISGGHTELVLIKNWNEYAVVGKTVDDAVGEAFDKVARILGLPYPGGPEISRLAESAREKKLASPYKLPRPMLHKGNLDFSFSGLKTAVLYLVRKLPELSQQIKEEISFEFEEAVTEVLLEKTKRALDEFGIQALLLGGGVIANKRIREAFGALGEERNIPVLLPEKHLATDNAIMIAIAGAMKNVDSKEFKAEGNLSF